LRRAALLVLLACCARARARRWAWRGVDASLSLIRAARRERRGHARLGGFARDLVRGLVSCTGTSSRRASSSSFSNSAATCSDCTTANGTTAHGGVSSAPNHRRHAPRGVIHTPRGVIHAPRGVIHAPRGIIHATSAGKRLHPNRGALRVPYRTSRRSRAAAASRTAAKGGSCPHPTAATGGSCPSYNSDGASIRPKPSKPDKSTLGATQAPSSSRADDIDLHP
jgi:hypothetical protein